MANTTERAGYTRSSDQLQRRPYGTAVEEVLEIIARDGGVILQNVLSSEQLRQINEDIDRKMDSLQAGLRDGNIYNEAFFGQFTKRITNMVMTSRVFREEIMAAPVTLAYQDALLSETADNIWLTAAQVIELQPGQPEQFLHRDFEAWPFFRTLGPSFPEIATNFLIALTESTEEMGATRIIPGSHRWEDYEYRGEPSMTIPVEMNAGDGLLTSARVLHCGGANRSNRKRRIMAMAYNVGWLTPEEAYPFMVPVEIARTLTPRAQQLIGFRTFTNSRGGSLWAYDMQELATHLGL